MRHPATFVIAAALVTLISIVLARAAENILPKMPMMKVVLKPNVQTTQMGGVAIPSAEALKAMHGGQYVLRARGGKLTKVPVEKTLLPHCPETGEQNAQVELGPEGTIYSRQMTLLCKSTDGGRSWSSRPISPPDGWTIQEMGRWKVLRDGTFICVSMKHGPDQRAPAQVWTSDDEGRTWKKGAKIPLDLKLPQTGKDYDERYCHRGLDRLRDDTLVWVVDIRHTPYTNGHGVFSFRSIDGGKTWDNPELMVDWGSEGAAVLLPSGRVLATMRYQRYPAVGDTAEIRKHMDPSKRNLGFKHVFLMDSSDRGRTWSAPRMLTTQYGQTFGYPAVQSDGTVVVIHDTRYGPGRPGARALMSRDEGKTWEDEVYYLDHSNVTGSYSCSVVMKDDTILTISASNNGKTDLYAIRWKPIKQ